MRGDLAQPLHNGVVVHDDHGLVLADARDVLADLSRQIEIAALPVTR